MAPTNHMKTSWKPIFRGLWGPQTTRKPNIGGYSSCKPHASLTQAYFWVYGARKPHANLCVLISVLTIVRSWQEVPCAKAVTIYYIATIKHRESKLWIELFVAQCWVRVSTDQNKGQPLRVLADGWSLIQKVNKQKWPTYRQGQKTILTIFPRWEKTSLKNLPGRKAAITQPNWITHET